jgi:hypothetical protein
VVRKGRNSVFVLKDKDCLIRTKFVNHAPETVIEKEYAPYYGGNHYDEKNTKCIKAPVNIKEKIRNC